MPTHTPISPLWKILHHHYEDFKAGYDERCEKQYGFFRPVVDEVVEEHLQCGDLREGFARVRGTNPECKHEYFTSMPLSPMDYGTFYCLPKRDLKELEEIFRSEVLAMLKGEGKINDELIEKLMNWRHSGFSVHAGNRIARDDRDGQQAPAEYILRNAFSEQKITYLEDTGKVLYLLRPTIFDPDSLMN